MKKQAILLCLTSLMLITSGCGGNAGESTAQAETKQKVVEAFTATKSAAAPDLTATGIIEAKRDVILSFGTSGKIGSINVEKGSQVAKGALLATIDPGYYQKAVEAAASQVKEAAERKAKTIKGASEETIAQKKLQLERLTKDRDKAIADHAQGEKLFAGGAISQSELDNLKLRKEQAIIDVNEGQVQLAQLLKSAEPDDLASADASYKQAASEAERAKKTLQDTKLVAPFAGTVVAVNQQEGELSNPGQEVIHLVDLAEMKISLDVSNDTIEQYKEGERVSIISDSGNKTSGTITFVSPMINDKTGKYQVEVTFSNDKKEWRGGMVATVEVPRKLNGFVVPLECVGVSQAGRYVLLIKNGQVVRQEVKVGQTIGNQLELVSGVQEGDQLINGGITYLVEGEKVVAKGAQ